MTDALPVRRSTDPGDRYMLALSCVLLGYALLGKGFAYFGYRPIFIGELTFIAGLLVLLRSGCLVALFASGPCLLLAATMAWTLSRTLPFVGTFGVDALRDSVIIMYGGFAFVTAALLIEDHRRIGTLVRYYRRFLWIYVPAVPVLFPLGFYFGDNLLTVPGTTVSLILIGAGEVAAHLTGAAVFTLAGFRKPTPVWTVCFLAALVMASAVSRAAMLAFVIPVVLAALALGKVRMLAVVSVIGLALLATSYGLEKTFSDNQVARSSTERRVSSVQLVENAASILGRGSEQTESTKEWREKWWRIIADNTLHGRYFWTGRGFGINLAIEDGFGNPHNARPLRSPHNSHIAILARAGVPGLVLWVVFLAAWFGAVLRTMLLARRRGQLEWVGLQLFIACYVLSCVINASFDVALEAPMQGIWFWCLIGFGIGTTMVYRYQQVSDQWKTMPAHPPVAAAAHGHQLPL